MRRWICPRDAMRCGAAVAGTIHVAEHYFYRGMGAAMALGAPGTKAANIVECCVIAVLA